MRGSIYVCVIVVWRQKHRPFTTLRDLGHGQIDDIQNSFLQVSSYLLKWLGLSGDEVLEASFHVFNVYHLVVMGFQARL